MTHEQLSFSVCPGYWNVSVFGRKHSYRLYSKLQTEASRWASAVQTAIDSKPLMDTHTQQLILDIKVTCIQMLTQNIHKYKHLNKPIINTHTQKSCKNTCNLKKHTNTHKKQL